MEEKYGKWGDPIPGSKYFRAYCIGCHEPIRVTQDQLYNSVKQRQVHRCEDCEEPGSLQGRIDYLTPRQQEGYKKVMGNEW